MFSSRKTAQKQGSLSPQSIGKEVAESTRIALARKASGDEDLLPHVATIETCEGDELDSDLEELDELLPSSDQPDTPQGTEESTPASMEASLATDVREDGSKIAITRTWDLQTSGLGVVEVVCKEAMSKYRTCAAYTYEEKGESSLGIFFHGEREAPEGTNQHHVLQGHTDQPPPTLPPTITPQAAPLALPDTALFSPPAEGVTDDAAAQRKLRIQALDTIYDTIQGGEWTGELTRAFKAIGLALGVDAYEAYPNTFRRAVVTKRRNNGAEAKVEVAVDADVAEGAVSKNGAEVLPASARDDINDAPASPTEKSRGKMRAQADGGDARSIHVAESSKSRRVRSKRNPAEPSPPPPRPKPDVAEEAPPAAAATRRSARPRKTVQKAVKPLVEGTTAAPAPTARRAKQPEVRIEPPPAPTTVRRERPALLSKRRPGVEFVRTVYYSP
ncbi:hypothetical protein PHLGIDRAFT_404642 [Phlebiopsis gigantea 11061_1 CR5-6]|uniref:Uncharacterized protein n=1 Tax=Phlebiopsis gigantea (strain 11061_1 CR5-6) TaxID=745531 RepID=A0A0C3NRQ0_PHLG1|nr:hypothetical protein PHLGIDRAFT_404642 [Phlebiopsis gigantea 11061_1 CR5-6]